MVQLSVSPNRHEPVVSVCLVSSLGLDASFIRGLDACFIRGLDACFIMGLVACFVRGLDACFILGGVRCMFIPTNLWDLLTLLFSNHRKSVCLSCVSASLCAPLPHTLSCNNILLSSYTGSGLTNLWELLTLTHSIFQRHVCLSIFSDGDELFLHVVV